MSDDLILRFKPPVLAVADLERIDTLVAQQTLTADEYVLAVDYLRKAREALSDLRAELVGTYLGSSTPITDNLGVIVLPSTINEMHVWGDRDIAYDLARAADAERAAAHAHNEGEWQMERLLLRRAAWHASRARTVAALVQILDAGAGWYHEEHVFDPPPSMVPGVTGSFVGGPFDGCESRMLSDPPRPLWIARRETGNALEGAFLVYDRRSSLAASQDPPAAPPSGGTVLGRYDWSRRSERYEWAAVQLIATPP